MSEYTPGRATFNRLGRATAKWSDIGNAQRGWVEIERYVIEEFIAEVNRVAEANMLKTGKLEGSHHAAIKIVMGRYK